MLPIWPSPNVSKDATCKFDLKLDDVAGDEYIEEMDNRSAGSFTVTESGSQEFKPEGQWRYTIYWHLKSSLRLWAVREFAA